MEQNDDLVRLAGVVEDLLANFNQLRTENAELQQTIKDREFQIRDLEEHVARLQGEKTDVSKRVSGILNSIQEWEKSLPQQEKKVEAESSQKSKPEPVAQLFSMEA